MVVFIFVLYFIYYSFFLLPSLAHRSFFSTQFSFTLFIRHHISRCRVSRAGERKGFSLYTSFALDITYFLLSFSINCDFSLAQSHKNLTLIDEIKLVPLLVPHRCVEKSKFDPEKRSGAAVNWKVILDISKKIYIVCMSQ